jgi:hypothetical protein
MSLPREMAAILAIAALAGMDVPESATSSPRRRPKPEPDRDATGGIAESDYARKQREAVELIRADRARRKAEAWAKRQPKGKQP